MTMPNTWKEAPPVGEDDFRVGVIVDAEGQERLEYLIRGRGEEPERYASTAVLVLENTGAETAPCLSVHVNGMRIGYIDAETAGTLVAAWDMQIGEFVLCDALIEGGWYRSADDHADFSVHLDLYFGTEDVGPAAPAPESGSDRRGGDRRGGANRIFRYAAAAVIALLLAGLGGLHLSGVSLPDLVPLGATAIRVEAVDPAEVPPRRPSADLAEGTRDAMVPIDVATESQRPIVDPTPEPAASAATPIDSDARSTDPRPSTQSPAAMPAQSEPAPPRANGPATSTPGLLPPASAVKSAATARSASDAAPAARVAEPVSSAEGQPAAKSSPGPEAKAPRQVRNRGSVAGRVHSRTKQPFAKIKKSSKTRHRHQPRRPQNLFADD